MPVWTQLCIFNYSAFTQTVIPALKAGEKHLIIQHAIEKLPYIYGLESNFIGLKQVVATCDSKMLSCSIGKDFFVSRGETIVDGQMISQDEYDLQYVNEKASELDELSMHDFWDLLFEKFDGNTSGYARSLGAENLDLWDYQYFAELFKLLVCHHTITHYYVFGSTPYTLEHLFPKNVFDLLPHILLDTLDRFYAEDNYCMNNDGKYGRGIRGWLDPQATELLLVALNELPMHNQAPYPPDSPIFERLYKDCKSMAQYDRFSPRDIYNSHWRKINIFRKIAQMAVDLKHGLLWGGDLLALCPTIFDDRPSSAINLEDTFDR